jgi:hypothetical protein
VADGNWRDLYMFDADAPATFIDQELALDVNVILIPPCIFHW